MQHLDDLAVTWGEKILPGLRKAQQVLCSWGIGRKLENTCANVQVPPASRDTWHRQKCEASNRIPQEFRWSITDHHKTPVSVTPARGQSRRGVPQKGSSRRGVRPFAHPQGRPSERTERPRPAGQCGPCLPPEASTHPLPVEGPKISQSKHP